MMKNLKIILLLLLVQTSMLFAATVTETLKDVFLKSTVESYDRQSGSISFTSDWIETGDDGSSISSGSNGTNEKVYIGRGHDYLYFDKNDNGITVDDGTYLTRNFDASAATDLVMSLGSLDNSLHTGNELYVQLWDGTSWVTIYTITSSNSSAVKTGTETAAMRRADGKVRIVPDSWSGSYTSEVGIASITITLTYTDTDGDGIRDEIDLDDDNDGILDSAECSVAIFSDGFDTITGLTDDSNNLDVDISPLWELDPSSARTNVVRVTGGSGYGDSGPHIDARGGAGNYFDAVGVGYVHHEFTLSEPSVVHFGGYISARDGDTGVGSKVYITEGAAYDGATVSSTTSVTTNDNVNWTYVDQISDVLPAGTYTLVTYLANEHNFDEGFVSLCPDSDDDGVLDKSDLDSDNDSIPDTVEAQPTASYVKITGLPTDVDANGVPNDASGGWNTPLPDSDGDGIPDYLDTDADNDLVTDCKEGIDLVGVTRICPVDNVTPGNTVGVNGLVEWAEGTTGTDDYIEVYGKINDPVFDLEDEITNNERAYREAACGPAEVNLTAMQWKTVSFPCDLGTNDLEAIIGGTNGLGTYGDNNDWVMYEQVAPDYTGNRNTMHLMVNGTDEIETGKGYWIISKYDKTVGINRPLAGIGQTYTTDANLTLVPPYYDQASAAFEKIMEYQLPSSSDTDFRKVMLGNPFFKSYNLSDMYLSNNGAPFASLSGFMSGSVIEPIVYIKDSTDVTTGNYVALDPGGTPGFGDRVPVMQGFWIKLNAGNSNTNTITFPFEK